jgi:hypothetical protein
LCRNYTTEPDQTYHNVNKRNTTPYNIASSYQEVSVVDFELCPVDGIADMILSRSSLLEEERGNCVIYAWRVFRWLAVDLIVESRVSSINNKRYNYNDNCMKTVICYIFRVELLMLMQLL